LPTPTPSASPTLTPSASPFQKGDVNHDGLVNQADMSSVLQNFGKQPSQVPNYFDPVGDTKINILDTGSIIVGI
jgi:hypothetical protein